jgi:hypothetical protein
MTGFTNIEKAGAGLIHQVYPDFYKRLKEEKLLVTKNTSSIPDEPNDAIAYFLYRVDFGLYLKLHKIGVHPNWFHRSM